jgi:hypothetical protein
LVLTEWKAVKTDGSLGAQIRQVRKQADRYAQGVLAGIELAGYRYLVVVSLDFLPIPTD